MTSPAQIAANRANSVRSTGPRTAEGKETSRRNALKHGLAARDLVLPEEEEAAIAVRLEAWTPIMAPRDAQEHWLVEQAVVSSVRMERCQAHEAALRTRKATRATLCWEGDREREAVELGATLAKSPELVASQLRDTKQGCAWLIGRWEGLGRILEARGDWDRAQRRLALDLLGIPPELREGPTPLDGDRPTLIREQVAGLEALQVESLEALDELERAAAEVGLGHDLDKALALVQRYEAASLRRFRWTQAELKKGRSPALKGVAASVARPDSRSLPGRLAGAIVAAVTLTPTPMAPLPPPIPQPIPALGNPTHENRRARRAREARARKS